MASFCDDFAHMNVEGASTAHGLALIIMRGQRKYSWLSPFGLNGTEWGILRGAISYAKNWETVRSADRRDVISALRTCGKGALIVAKIAMLL